MSKLAGTFAVLASLTSITGVVSAQQFAAPPPSSHRAAVATEERARVRQQLVERREANIASFEAYVDARSYPSNTMSRGSLNVWRDRDGHLCAAATIIDRSGAHELVKHVGDTDNNLRLATVTDGAIEDWILESGLTQEELVRIQLPFQPVVERPGQPVDPDLRQAETARLSASYVKIEKELADEQQAALDLATDRLMQHPELAADLAYGRAETTAAARGA